MTGRGDSGAERILAPPAATPPEPLAAPPAISVVVPAYQSAATIAAALDSALAQRPAPCETIVVDDGSTDALERALAPYHGKIDLVRQGHAGVAAARNAGVRRASGDFVLFLDADDLLLPGKLAALGRLAQVRPDLDILGTDIHFEAAGERRGRFCESNPFPRSGQRAAILERCFVVQATLRRSSLLAVGGFDESLRSGVDWDCLARLILEGSTAGVYDEPLAVYRIREQSLTGSRAKTLRDRARIVEKALSLPGMRPEERPLAERLLAAHRARAALAEAQNAVAAGRRGARRRCLRLALSRRIAPHDRLWAALAFAAPSRWRPWLTRRFGGDSQLRRALPGDDAGGRT